LLTKLDSPPHVAFLRLRYVDHLERKLARKRIKEERVWSMVSDQSGCRGAMKTVGRCTNQNFQASSSSTVSTQLQMPWQHVRTRPQHKGACYVSQKLTFSSRRVQERPTKPCSEEPGTKPLSKYARRNGLRRYHERHKRHCTIAVEVELPGKFRSGRAV
jgi:hypothetical protein